MGAVEREFLAGVGDRTQVTGRWRWAFLLTAFGVACLLVALRDTARDMVHTWQSSKTYSHCFLILPMVAYLVWIRRERLLLISPRITYSGLLSLIPLLAAWIVGCLGEAKVVQEFALVTLVAALILAFLGAEALRILAFPLSFLFFAVPAGISLVKPLQNFTAWFTVHALTLSSVPAVLENHTISLPTSVWAVAETCSGIRYLFASLVIGVFYSSIVYRSWKRRIIFVLTSIILPIMANGVRAYAIVMVAYLTDYKVATGIDHIIYGGVFFITLQITLLSIGFRWREIGEGSPRLALRGLPNPGARLSRGGVLVPATAIILITVAPLLAKHLWDRSAAAAGLDAMSVTADQPWQRVTIASDNWDQDCSLKQGFRERFESGPQYVDVCWTSYSGNEEAELQGAAKGYGNPEAWSLAAQGREHAILNGHNTTLEQDLMQSGTNVRVLWTVYWVGGEYTADASRVKLLQAKARLLGKSAATAVIVLGSENPVGGVEADQKALQNFLIHASFAVSPQS